jgi:hypothetical protein
VRLPEERPKGSQRRAAKTGIERGSFSEVQVQSDRAVEIGFEIVFPQLSYSFCCFEDVVSIDDNGEATYESRSHEF